MRHYFNGPEVPVYAPNSYGGPHADPERAGDGGLWDFDGRAVRAGYIKHAEDDDFAQAGTMVREVLDDAQRERLANNIIGHASNGVTEEVLLRVFQYWKNVDPDLGRKVEEGVRAELAKKDGQAGNGKAPQEGQSSVVGSSEKESAVQVGAQA